MPYAFDNPTDVDADADTISWASVTRAAGFDAFAATPSSANFAALVTGETGSGAIVFGTSPTLSNPTLSGTVAGTPTFSGSVTFAAISATSVNAAGTSLPLTVNSTNSNQLKVILSDNGTARGYLGADGTLAFVVANNAASNILTLTQAGALSAGGVAVPTISSTDTLSNKTLSSPTLSGTVAGTPTFSGVITIAASGIPLTVNSTSSSTSKILLSDNGVTRAYVGADGTYSTYLFNASGTVLSRWTQTSGLMEHLFDMTVTGDVRINGGQLYFGGTSAYLNYSATDQLDIVTVGSTRLRIDAAGLVTANNGLTVLGSGVLVGAPTGGNKGAGTINATAVYDDNTLLTCYIIEAWKYGAIDLAKWDALTPDLEHAAVYETVDTGETDADGNAITEQHVVTEAWTEQRQHTPARGFANVAAARLDIDNFSQFVFDNERLPAFPAPDRWQEMYEGKMATGDLIQRLWETVEVMAVHSIEARKRELALIARVEALEAAT